MALAEEGLTSGEARARLGLTEGQWHATIASFKGKLPKFKKPVPVGAKPADLTGMRFGRLVAKELAARATERGKSRWLCVCDCGEAVSRLAYDLRSGRAGACPACKASARSAKLAATKERKRASRKSSGGHSRHSDEAEYGMEASRRRQMARIAERIQIVTAYHASDRKIPKPSFLA